VGALQPGIFLQIVIALQAVLATGAFKSAGFFVPKQLGKPAAGV
jgi:hypothetical protein